MSSIEIDLQRIIIRPVTSEKAITLVERENTITLIVDRRANKKMIRDAVERIFGVEVEDVRTMITRRGEKKAYIRLKKEYKASEIATRLGML